MKFKIPFTFASIDKQRKRSAFLRKYFKTRKNSKISLYLENSEINLNREEYLAICLRNVFLTFFWGLILFTTFLFAADVKNFMVYGILISFALSVFVFLTQTSYPKLFSQRREREIDRNLIDALKDMLVQLSSGIPLFSILVNLSISDYGALSGEFKKIVKKINTGTPEIEVLEETSEKSTSVFFRRTLWQISNGLKSGSDLSIVIRDSLGALNGEQLIQIQKYGNKLNPLIMFYMLVSIIAPALSITFLTVISSMVGLSEKASTILYISLFVFVMFVQIMFLGILRAARPRLL